MFEIDHETDLSLDKEKWADRNLLEFVCKM